MTLDGKVKCWCGGAQELCLKCTINIPFYYCKGNQHPPHDCTPYSKQKVGELKYYPPIPKPEEPKNIKMAPPNMYPDRSTIHRNPAQAAQARQDQIDGFMATQRAKQEILSKAVQELRVFSFKDVLNEEFKDYDLHKLALRVNRIFMAFEREDEKALGQIFKHIVKKEKQFLPCIKAFVKVYRLNKWDARMFRVDAYNYLHMME